MVVDPDPVVADSLSLILRKNNCEVKSVSTAEQAMELAEHFRPHAVIAETLLDGRDGAELALHLTERMPECRVLLVSAIGPSIPVLRRTVEVGCSASVLSKPVHPKHVLEFVNSCAA